MVENLGEAAQVEVEDDQSHAMDMIKLGRKGHPK